MLLEESIIRQLEGIINEVTVKYKDIWSFRQSSAFKTIENAASRIFKRTEPGDETKYRERDWKKDPVGCVKTQIEELFFAIQHLKALDFVGFAEDRVKKAKSLIVSAERSYNRVQIKLKQNTTPEEFAKNFKAATYTTMVLTLYSEFFEALGIEWDYVFPWYNTEKDVDIPRMHFEKKAGPFNKTILRIYERNNVDSATKLIAEELKKLVDPDDVKIFKKISERF